MVSPFLMLCFLALAAPHVLRGESQPSPWIGRFSWAVESEDLILRSGIYSAGGSRACLAFDATGGSAELAGGFRLLPGSPLAGAASDQRKTRLQFGPGRPAGLSSILAAPASLGARIEAGTGAEFDTSLESRTSILALDAPWLSLFALSRGSSSRARLAGLNVQPAAGVERSDCLGAGIVLGGADCWWAFVAAASRVPSALYHGAILRGLARPGGSCSAALAASFGRLEGGSLAARIEAEQRIGRLRARLSFGAAGGNFLCLFGKPPDSVLGLSGELRIGLGRGAYFEGKASCEGSDVAERGRLSVPAFSREFELDFTAPFRQGRIETGFSVEEAAGGGAVIAFSLAFVREWKIPALSRRIGLYAELPALDGAEAEEAAGLADPAGLGGSAAAFPLPEIELKVRSVRLGSKDRDRNSTGLAIEAEAALLFFEGGSMEAPARGRCGVALSLPASFGEGARGTEGARLELEISLSEEWADLCVLASEEEAPRLRLRLSYEAAYRP